MVMQKTNSIPNRQVMCDVLLEEGKKDKNLIVLTSDSRGSAKLETFAEELPGQLVEVGISEQNIVSIAAGLAHSGKKAFSISPAAFLSMRSIEQIKVDVAYSDTNVKLIGISGGVSYGQLGMSHHSLQDLAVTRAIPNLQVMMPADRFETEKMFQALVKSQKPAYVRLGRNPVEDSYESADYPFEIGKAVTMKDGYDLTFVASGETVRPSLDAAEMLEKEGIFARVINMHTIKPLDVEAIFNAAKETRGIISVEEHSIYGGLGGAIAEVLSEGPFIKHKIIGIADEPAVTGSSKQVFEHYGLHPDYLVESAHNLLNG